LAALPVLPNRLLRCIKRIKNNEPKKGLNLSFISGFLSYFYPYQYPFISKSKTDTMPLELLTTSDLVDFRAELLKEFKQLLSEKDVAITGKFLKSREVRAILRISPGTLQNLRRNKTLSFTKIGRIIYYDYEDIQKLVRKKI
jgi:hypothetical protein